MSHLERGLPGRGLENPPTGFTQQAMGEQTEMRYEIKLVAQTRYGARALAWVNMHPEGFYVAYPPRIVNTLYLDTPAAGSLRANLFGLSERTKLRYRWYGDDLCHVQGQMEIKHKANQLGWKEIQPISAMFDLTRVPWREMIGSLRQEAVGSFGVWLATHAQPMLITSYLRHYFASADGQLRLTVDQDLRMYEQILHVKPNLTCAAPPQDALVIEIKAGIAQARRISDLLTTCSIPVRRHSKYVTGVQGALSFR
jgi:hypothetical protein